MSKAVPSNSTLAPSVPLPAVLMSALAPAEGSIPAGEFRALTVHEFSPIGCQSIQVPHGRFGPHLRVGERAVFDQIDREPISGEMYLVRINSPRAPGGFVRELVQIRQRPCGHQGDPDGGWMLHFALIRSHGRRLSADEVLAKMRSGEVTACDGPLSRAGMRDKIIGRVVGVILSGDA